MSASLDAPARRFRPPGGARHVGSLAAVPLILLMLVAGIVSADPPAAAVRLSAADAARAGSTIGLVRHAVAGDTLIEVLPARGIADAGPAANLLAVSPDGAAAALADQVGELSGSLTVARADGSQLRVQLPGIIAASFAADGAWLAVIDGRGALWQVDAESGDAIPLAEGPFLGTPIATADGSLLLLSVSSVEAPYRSRLVRFAPSTGAATLLSPDELVYAAFALADGGVAVAAHEPGRTVVARIGVGGDAASQLLADLGPGAVNVAVSGDAQKIAFEAAGLGIFLIDSPGARPRRLGDGSNPCFAGDGSALLIRRGAGSVALALDGSTLAAVGGAARFAGAAGCPS